MKIIKRPAAINDKIVKKRYYNAIITLLYFHLCYYEMVKLKQFWNSLVLCL